MAQYTINLPYLYVPDPQRGRPVFNGEIYIGEVDKDPELFPIQAYIQNANGTLSPVLQPLATGSGGVVLVNGSPAQIVVQQNYSMRVRDSLGGQVYYVPNGLAGGSGGGGGDEDYVPLAGTSPGLPITGQLIFTGTGSIQDWQVGFVAGGFDGFWIASDNNLDPDAKIGFLVGDIFTVINRKGELLLNTDYSDPTLASNAAVTAQYVQDAIGSPTGSFIPLAGTNATTGDITGVLQFENTTLGTDASFGILEGLTDLMTLYSDHSILIASGPDAPNQWWDFDSNGQLLMPDIDYSLADPLAAVNKAYVDSQGGGGTGAYVPLAGTTTGQEVTGLIKFKDDALNQEWQLGIVNVPGLWQNMSISSTADSDLPTSFAIIAGGSFYTFGSDGVLQLNDINALGNITADGILTNGIIDTGGAQFGGGVTVTSGDLNLTDGQLSAQGGLLTTSIVGNGIIIDGGGSIDSLTINNSSPIYTNEATRKDYVDGRINTRLPLTGGTLSGGLAITSSSLQLVIPSLASGGGNIVRWVSSGSFQGAFLQSTTVQADEVEVAPGVTLAAKIADLEARLVLAGF